MEKILSLTKVDHPPLRAIPRAVAWTLPLLIFSALTALGAQISIPIPGTPVPVTLQTMVVLLSGAWIGGLRGSLSQFVYVGVGLFGLPVFAGESSGWSVLWGATGGYLIGFLIAPIVVSRICRTQTDWIKTVLGLWISSLVIFACGLSWLIVLHKIPVAQAFQLGLYPFMIGDILKVCFASSLLKVTFLKRQARHD